MPNRNSILVVVLLVALLLSPAASAQAAPSQTSIPPNIVLEPVISGLDHPVLATNAGDGSGRIFIVQQTGQILILKGTTLNATPFLDVSGLITNPAGGEQGLLGLAFDPNYSTNGNFFITYTDKTDVGNDILERFHVSANADIADSNSGQIVLSVTEPFENHNGGNIAFGPDGFLYFGLGDGGNGGDPQGNGQNTNTLLGKLLRLDVSSLPYSIPSGNPFTGAGVKHEIWSYGLRNPWRFSFDKSTGDLYVGDVGQGAEEEIDFQAAGAAGGQNYGWNSREGNLCYATCTIPSGYVPPVSVYTHSDGCAVTGGYVYRGTQFPALQGVYLFSDYCSGTLWGMYKNSSNQWVKKAIMETGYNVSSFGEDEAGELYIVDLGGNLVHIGSAPLLSATFMSKPIPDGYILESRMGSGVGGGINSDKTFVMAGDNASDKQYRSILSFMTGSLPDNAVVASARLTITKMNTIGGDPFASLGRLVADIGNPVFGSSPRLQAGDFQAAPGAASSVMFISPPVGNTYGGGVNRASLSHISLTSYTQFRLRFTIPTDNNHANNRINIFSGNSATGKPQLMVSYFVP
jgi:glucose/arabinose dehydrogenase